jgi:hypothetical protein
MSDLSKMSDSELLAMYALPALVKQESGGRAGVLGPQTKYGRAEGMTQMLPDTARATAQKIGMPWQPELMRGDTPEAAEYQQRLGEAYLREGIEATGDLDGGLRYYHGGPNRQQWGPKTDAYARSIQAQLGVGAAPAEGGADLSSLSDDELLAMYQGGEQAAPQGREIARTANGGVTMEVLPPAAPQQAPGRPQQPQRTSQGLGLAKGAMEPLARLSGRIEGNSVLDRMADQATAAFPMMGALRGMLDTTRKQAMPAIAAAEAGGARPGKVGQFAGNVLAALPLGGAGGPMTSGALAGGFLSDAEDARGIAGDAAFGAVAGRVGDEALKLVGKAAQPILGKVKAMALPELEAAKKAAYAKVDASGFTFNKADAQALAGDVEALVRAKGGPKAAKLFPAGDAFAARLKALAAQKGGVPLTQLDELRSDIYEAMVKPGGSESVVGKAMREKIDGLIATASNENALLREARDLNTRWAKANVVTKRLESADLARGRAYTGKNTDNTIRQKLSPLIDPMHGGRLRNATSDEAKALKRVVTGSPAQNVVRTMGTLLDPRGVIGMGLQATGAAKSGGLSLASIPLGLASTAVSGRMSQKNVEELLKLIAVGGSRSALKKQATPASRALEAVAQKVRPAAGLIGASAASQARAKERR